jgi:HSP90 family molecular chaperone
MQVITKGSEGQQYRWEASADSLDKYTIAADDSTPIETTGTRIVLHLKDESDQYLDDVALKALLEKYSEFIAFPIELQKQVSRPESVADTSAPLEADGTIPMKTVMKKVLEWSVVNDKKPLWLRAPKACVSEDYDEFYKQTFKAYDKPMATSHFTVEGNVDFKAILFLPSEVSQLCQLCVYVYKTQLSMLKMCIKPTLCIILYIKPTLLIFMSLLPLGAL